MGNVLPMSGLEIILIIGLFVIILWPSRMGKGFLSRLKSRLAPRRRTAATRIKRNEPARPASPAAPEKPVKPAWPPAVRVGKTRRAYGSARAGR
jgi:hypothetical protein